MLRIKKIILESLYDDDEVGIMEFEYGDMLSAQAAAAFSDLQEELKKVGIETSVNYPHISKISIITKKEYAQQARELAEEKGFRFISEIFDTRDREYGEHTPPTDGINARVGSGFNSRWGF